MLEFEDSFDFSEVTQSRPTLSDPLDCSLPGSCVHGIFQARVLEWVAISFSRELPDPGIEPGSPALQADTLPSEPRGSPTFIHKWKDIEKEGHSDICHSIGKPWKDNASGISQTQKD